MIAAVDSKGGQVVIHGWKTALPLTALDAVSALEPYCGEFLYTHVDAEGLMGGTDIEAILGGSQRHDRRLTAAGGITTREEIDTLDAQRVDAVVGMAVYTGKLHCEARQSGLGVGLGLGLALSSTESRGEGVRHRPALGLLTEARRNRNSTKASAGLGGPRSSASYRGARAKWDRARPRMHGHGRHC